jgi:branched-chain amino acid transport system ATP-binding protein
MLMLAQTMMLSPRLVMIDELSLGLAPLVVESLVQTVREMRDHQVTFLLVEQSVNVALTVATRAYFLEKGRIRFEGDAAQLLQRPDVLRSVFIAGASATPASTDASGVTETDQSSREPVARPVLEVEGVSRSYGGIRAVSDVSLTLHPGEIVGVIGPNGAGKTSLFDLIAGSTAAERGRVLLEGADVTGVGPDARARRGMGRSFQDARLFPGLTVSETIAVSFERSIGNRDPLAAALHLPVVAESEKTVAGEVDELIELLGLGEYQDKFISELSMGTRRMVDLACTIAHRPSVLLLDEPSSGIAQKETEALSPFIERIRDETDCAILIIEHDMPFISSVSDRLIAMELGSVLVEGPPDHVLNDEKVITSYLGTSSEIIARSGVV